MVSWSFALAFALDLPVQGALSDGSGAPIHGVHDVTFTLAAELPDASIDAFWSDTLAVTVMDGEFSVFLPDVPAERMSEARLYVQASLDGGAPTPLLPVGWAPRAAYAAEAGHAQEASHADVASAVSGEVDAAQLSGTIADARLASNVARTTGAAFSGAVSGTRFTQSQAPSASADLVPLGFLDGRLATYLPLTGGTLTGALSGTSATFSGTVSGTFSGSGAALTGLDATALSAGTVPDARLASTVARTTGAAFTGAVSSSFGTYPQLSANPATGHAYIRMARADAAAGEAGLMWSTGATPKWWLYMNENDDTTLRFNAGGDRLTLNDAGDANLSGTLIATDVNTRIFNIRPSIGAQDFWAHTAFAVCAARYPTFRYLERRGSSSCAAKCADSEADGGGCLGALGLGGNTSPWTDNGCAATTSSITYCCCSW
jgi:hypothetical protein